MQATDGHLKPIPPEDDFATPRRGGTGGRTSPSDPDLALAIRLQQEEMTRMRGSPQGAHQIPLPPFTRNPVGPTPPPSLPQRARSALLLGKFIIADMTAWRIFYVAHSEKVVYIVYYPFCWQHHICRGTGSCSPKHAMLVHASNNLHHSVISGFAPSHNHTVHSVGTSHLSAITQ